MAEASRLPAPPWEWILPRGHRTRTPSHPRGQLRLLGGNRPSARRARRLVRRRGEQPGGPSPTGYAAPPHVRSSGNDAPGFRGGTFRTHTGRGFPILATASHAPGPMPERADVCDRCDGPPRIRPAFVPRTTGRRQETARTAEQRIRRSHQRIRPSSQVGRSAPADTLKVETRVRTPLGLPGETHHRRTRLHPGKGADTGIQDTPKRRSKTLIRRGHSSLVPHSSRRRRHHVTARDED